jgi:eukaryotic-like serine/threonine-protein kinase
MSAELSRDPDFRARFLREADLAATLDHPNIVEVYNRGETDEGQLWIAMQYVPGSDADKELKHGGMTAARAVHIVVEVAKALDYAHRRNLLHRDVKPANFLLAANDERVFLADFGIARALDDATKLTSTGTVLASVAYAAPESLTGQRLDSRADIYSLGCSLFQMLSGSTPFAGSGWAGTAAAHLSQPPPRLTDRNPALPRAIDDVIAKAMAKEPDERYPSAQDLARAAAQALDAEVTAPVQPREATTAPLTPGPPAPVPARPPNQPSPRQTPPPTPPVGGLAASRQLFRWLCQRPRRPPPGGIHGTGCSAVDAAPARAAAASPPRSPRRADHGADRRGDRGGGDHCGAHR